MTNVPEIFGCLVFNDTTMKARLPKETYKAMKTAALIGFKPIVFDAPYWFDQKENAEYCMGIVGFHLVRSMPSDTLLFYKVRPVIKLK